MTFGERLKQIREEKGFTLAHLGTLIGVSEATIQRYESGEIKNPKHERIVALAAALGVKEGTLMGWETDVLDEDIRILARNMQKMPTAKKRQVIRLINAMMDDDDDE
jgi:HTH-type transcriptional regulator, cell division transcriptional repressor